MKNTISVILLLFCIQTAWTQAATSSSDNYSAIRLIIVNDRGELLMRLNEFGWMTPSVRYNTPQTVAEVLDSLTAAYGIKTSTPVLAGLFTYKYTFNTQVSTRQFYVAYYKEGKLISPQANETVKWLPREEAMANLQTTVSSLAEMTNQVLNFPDTIWAAAFLLNKVDGKLSSTKIEDFYPIGKTLKAENTSLKRTN